MTVDPSVGADVSLDPMRGQADIVDNEAIEFGGEVATPKQKLPVFKRWRNKSSRKK